MFMIIIIAKMRILTNYRYRDLSTPQFYETLYGSGCTCRQT